VKAFTLIFALILGFATQAQAVLTPRSFAFRGFNPNAYGNTIWWIAARKETAYADNDSVATATDWSASAINASNSTNASKPTYKTAIVNSQAVFRADGVNDVLVPSSNPLSGKSAATICIVFKDNSDPPSGTGVTGDPAGGPMSGFGSDAAATGDHMPWVDGNVYCGLASTARKSAGNPSTSLASWTLMTIVSAANDYRIYINGQLFYSTVTNTFGAAASMTRVALLTSYDSTGGYYPYAGDLAEIVIWDSALGTAAREGAEDALGAIYGMTITH
jgi:hypothetical protein